MDIQREKITITTEYIKLDQLLKFSGTALSGAEAHAMITDGIVDVNGEVCTVKRKKIVNGDIIAVHGEDITVELEVEGPL